MTYDAVAFRGSFICDSYDVRVTRRCLVEDLAARDDAPMADLLGGPAGTTVEQALSEAWGALEDLPELRRVPGSPSAAIWLDGEHGATAWIVACSSEDTLQDHCRGLGEAGRLLPDPVDLHHAQTDTLAAFLHGARVQAPLLLKRAQEQGCPQRLQLGIRPVVDVVVEYRADDRRTLVHLPRSLPRGLAARDGRLTAAVLAAFHADGRWAAIESAENVDFRTFCHDSRRGAP